MASVPSIPDNLLQAVGSYLLALFAPAPRPDRADSVIAVIR